VTAGATTYQGSAPSRQGASALTATRLVDALLITTTVTLPLTKFYFEFGGKLVLSNLLGLLFVAAYLVCGGISSRAWSTRHMVVLAWFMGATTLIAAAGFVGIDEPVARSQFYKGFATWVIHVSFLMCAAARFTEAGMQLVEKTLRWFVFGALISAAWGVMQLVGVKIGADIDRMFIAPLPFAAEGNGNVQYYGGGLWRVTGLTLDSNHLGVISTAPLMIVLAWWRGWQRWAAAALLTIAMVFTLSRSAVLGIVAGAFVIAWQYRDRLLSARVIAGVLGSVAAAVVAIALLVALAPGVAQSLIFGRLDVGGNGAQTHLGLYALVPGLLAKAPLFGNGLNSFALLFADINGGREAFGPHSHYIHLLVETGLLGFTMFAAFAVWMFSGLLRIVSPATTALAAALAALLAGNVFYLTTQLLYVELLFAAAVVLPAVSGIRYHRVMPTAMTPSDSATSETLERALDGDAATGSDLLRRAMRWWWIVAVAAIVGAGLGIAATSGRTTMWKATATVYLGQPVGSNGQLLNTIGAKAATGIDLATGDEAIREAADKAGVSRARVRDGLTVTAVQSPLASKLQTPPAIVKVVVADKSEAVAEQAAGAISTHLVDETSEYTKSRRESISAEVGRYEQQVDELTAARRSALDRALSASSGDQALFSVLASNISSNLSNAQADLASAKAELQTIDEIEMSRVIDKPAASKAKVASRTSSIVIAAFLGALVGAMIALLLARRTR
jgi:O-antigen ligase